MDDTFSLGVGSDDPDLAKTGISSLPHGMIGGVGEPGYFVSHHPIWTSKQSKASISINKEKVGVQDLTKPLPNREDISLRIKDSEPVAYSRKVSINGPDRFNAIREVQEVEHADKKDIYPTQWQGIIEHSSAFAISENSDTITLPQIAIEGIKHAAFAIPGTAKDLGSNVQLKLPSKSPTPSNAANVAIPQIVLVPKCTPSLSSDTQAPSPQSSQTLPQRSQTKMPPSQLIASFKPVTAMSTPQPRITMKNLPTFKITGKTITSKAINPSKTLEASPTAPKPNAFPTLPPILLGRPLKYYDNVGRHPHLHAGKMKLFVPTGVEKSGGAIDYEAKEVYPPYRYVSRIAGKKLIPVFSGDHVIALVPAGSYLKQNNTARAHRRGIVPIPPANMVQLRRQTAFNPPSKKHLAVHLEFDQYQGDLMLDTSGHENNALATGAATRMMANFSCGMAERLIGGQVSFNGTNFAPKPTIAATIAVWIKLRSSKGRQSIFYTVGKGQYNLAAEDGKIVWSHMDDNEKVVFKLITLYEHLKPNKWAHIAGTYDSVEGMLLFYFTSLR